MMKFYTTEDYNVNRFSFDNDIFAQTSSIYKMLKNFSSGYYQAQNKPVSQYLHKDNRVPLQSHLQVPCHVLNTQLIL